MTNFNERTNTLLYKNISLTLYSRKGWCWLCVRGELEMGIDCYIDPAVLLSHLGWAAQPMGHWGPKPLCLPLTLNSAFCLQLTPTGSDRLGHLVIQLSYIHLLPLFFRLFTQVHLLIDGLVEGQYVTSCHHSRTVWSQEQWQWRGTQHSPKLQHYWNLTFRLFSVVYRILVVYILQSQPTGLTLVVVVGFFQMEWLVLLNLWLNTERSSWGLVNSNNCFLKHDICCLFW